MASKKKTEKKKVPQFRALASQIRDCSDCGSAELNGDICPEHYAKAKRLGIKVRPKKKVPPLRAGAKAPGKKKKFRLEVGKTYYRRDGNISEPVRENDRSKVEARKYPFLAGFMSYKANGFFWASEQECDADLVRAVKQVKKG